MCEPPYYLLPLRRLAFGRRSAIEAYAIVDAEDYERVVRYRWCLDTNGYVMRGERFGGRVRAIKLHRELCGLAERDPRQPDHIDRDPLNNRRSNLRIGTSAQNS